ncbi:MAG: hypothetical protein AB8B91_25700 [Rubripirellula sp.]
MSKAGTPDYRLHATGQATVRLSGKDIYLGKYGTAASRAKYDEVVQEWLANGRRLPDDKGDSVAKMLTAFLKHAKAYYKKNGKQTNEYPSMKRIAALVGKMFGKTPVEKFGPLRFQAVRKAWIDKGNSLQTINKDAGRLKSIFKWGVANELCPPHVYHAIKEVAGLKAGRVVGVKKSPPITMRTNGIPKHRVIKTSIPQARQMIDHHDRLRLLQFALQVAYLLLRIEHATPHLLHL